MPVPAVIIFGMPTVSSGSQIDDGRQHLGWKMIFFTCVSELVSTLARPTSEPVPAVVGTATMGCDAVGIGAGPPVADILEIPDRPGLAGHEGDHLAQIEAGAAAKRDHAVMAAVAKTLTPGFEVDLVRVRVDLGEHRAAEAGVLHQVERALVISIDARPRSVTSSGRVMPGGGAGLADLGDAAGAETDGGGIGPVGGEGHASVFLRCDRISAGSGCGSR
jgi:hypothetical protein